VARIPPDLGLPELGAAAQAQLLTAERLVGQREPGLRLPAGRVALEQQAGGDAGQAGCPRADLDQVIRVRQGTAQVVQDLAQVRVRLALGRVGPEQERQALTRLRSVTVEQQVGEQ
jgi:hypothetical protein